LKESDGYEYRSDKQTAHGSSLAKTRQGLKRMDKLNSTRAIAKAR